MNDLSSTVGRCAASSATLMPCCRASTKTRKLFEPVRCKQKKAAEGPPPRRLYISIWLRTGRKAEALPLL